VVLRPDESSKKFSVIPKRWIVERTFSWVENCRRLSMDFEFLSESALAMLQSSFIMLLLRKLFK
jgi:putative transposase